MVVAVSLSTKYFNDCGGAGPVGFNGVNLWIVCIGITYNDEPRETLATP